MFQQSTPFLTRMLGWLGFFSLSQMCIFFQLHFGIGFTHTHARTHAHANTIKPLYVSVEIMLGINIELKADQIQAVLTTFFESKRLGCLDIIPGNNEQFPFFFLQNWFVYTELDATARNWVGIYREKGVSHVFQSGQRLCVCFVWAKLLI